MRLKKKVCLCGETREGGAAPKDWGKEREREKVKVKTDSLGGERTRKLLHHEGQESPSAALLNTLA